MDIGSQTDHTITCNGIIEGYSPTDNAGLDTHSKRLLKGAASLMIGNAIVPQIHLFAKLRSLLLWVLMLAIGYKTRVRLLIESEMGA